jgi:hypothetical protein
VALLAYCCLSLCACLSQAVSFPVWLLSGSILANDRLLPGIDKRPRRTKARSPRAVPWETQAPVGCHHGNPRCRRLTSPRRPRARMCLRKGCGRKYQPRCWNQRYCQDPACQRQVRRWQAARRQARRRLDAAAKAQHAQAQRLRRQRAKAESQTPKPAEVAAARGHAAEIFFSIFCVPGRVARSGPRTRSATRHAIAAPPAGRPYAMSWIANASGGRAGP